MNGIDDLVGKIIRLESGEMTTHEAIRFGSELVKTGTYLHLQGSYHRFINSLLRDGQIDEQGNILNEAVLTRIALEEIDQSNGIGYTEVIRRLKSLPLVESIETGHDKNTDTHWATIVIDGHEFRHKAYWALDCILGAVGRIVRPEHYEDED